MRTKKAPKRVIKPDTKYNSVKVSRLINRAMKSGKKSAAQRQIYAALSTVAKTTKQKPLDVLDNVVANISPKMEVRSRRVGGAAYQVPMPVGNDRSFSLALRWLVQAANKRPNKQYHTFGEKLAAEMLDALENQGGAVDRKTTSHKMSEANRAFAHFRW